MPRFHVSRSVVIAADANRVYDAVADYGTWTTWSPWLIAEPDAKVEVSDPASQVGSTYSWDGDLVGSGELEHLNLKRGELIEDEIRFFKPFKSKSQVRFELVPVTGGTQLTWHMQGSLPFFLFWMVSSMQTYIGMDYARGLKMLKQWIETGSILSQTIVRGVETVPPLAMIGIRGTAPLENPGPAIHAKFQEATERFKPICGDSAIPITVYPKMDIKRKCFQFIAGYTVPSLKDIDASGATTWSLPETLGLVVEHVGSYDHLGNAWSAAQQVARYQKLKLDQPRAFERYTNSPEDTPVEELRTEIVLPLN